MDEVTYDPRDVSTTISGQGSVPSDYDPRDNNSGILSTSFRRVSRTEHGATVPWHANQDDWGRTIPDPVPGKEAFDRINDAAVKGYQGTPFIQAPEARDFLNKSPVGQVLHQSWPRRRQPGAWCSPRRRRRGHPDGL